MRQTASPEKWKELYGIARELECLEPWHCFHASQLIAIQPSGRSEPLFCSILDSDEGGPGVSVYDGIQGLYDFHMLTCPENSGLSDSYALFDHDALTCRWMSQDAIPSDQRRLICEWKLPTPGTDNWPFFLSYRKRFMPCLPDEDETGLLIDLFRNLIDAVHRYQSDPVCVDWEHGEILWHFYNMLRGCWNTFPSSMPNPRRPYPPMRLGNELLRKRLQKQDGNGAILLVDFIYLGIPVHDHHFERPLNPHAILVLDAGTKALVYKDILQPDDSEAEALARFFIHYVMENGRMTRILARHPLVFGALADTCRYCGVELKEGTLSDIDSVAILLTDLLSSQKVVEALIP